MYELLFQIDKEANHLSIIMQVISRNGRQATSGQWQWALLLVGVADRVHKVRIREARGDGRDGRYEIHIISKAIRVVRSATTILSSKRPWSPALWISHAKQVHTDMVRTHEKDAQTYIIAIHASEAIRSRSYRVVFRLGFPIVSMGIRVSSSYASFNEMVRRRECEWIHGQSDTMSQSQLKLNQD